MKSNEIVKCPNCGDLISGLNQVCPSCGFIFNSNNEYLKNLHSSLNRLEELIIEVKSVPKPSFTKNLITALFSYMTLGIYYIAIKLLQKKQDSFEKVVARCEKEKRQIKTYFGDDKKVSLLLNELDTEINAIKIERNKLSKQTSIGCFSVFIILILLYLIANIFLFKYYVPTK